MIDRSLLHTVQGSDTDGKDGLPLRSCPVCHETDTVAMASGVSRAGRGRFVLGNGSTGEYETELSGLLAGPPRPREIPFHEVPGAALVGAMMAILTFIVATVLRSQEFITVPAHSLDAAVFVGLSWFGIFIPILTLARYLEARHRAANAWKSWQEADSTWRTARYCSRDDVVFLVDTDMPPTRPEEAYLLWTSESKPKAILNSADIPRLEQATQ